MQVADWRNKKKKKGASQPIRKEEQLSTTIVRTLRMNILRKRKKRYYTKLPANSIKNLASKK
jgi:hypothetical protein